MKYTKNILFLYISMLTGYCLKEFFTQYNTLLSYVLLTALCYIAISSVYSISLRLGRPLAYTEKRIHTGKRETGMDIARSIAVLFVPLIHFFGLAGYYNTQFTSELILPSAIRWLSLCAVPLFLIITGYFKCTKTISKAHYKAIIPVLATHIFISLIRVIVDNKYHGINADGRYIADKLLFFGYGWYVRLYIGMLLIMPFFNACWKQLGEKWKKEALILTLIGLTALGPLTYDIVPSSWLIIYVFAYYAIGAYLYEYKVCINPIAVIIMIAGLCFIMGKTAVLHCMGSVFDWSFAGYQNNSGYSSMAAFIIAPLIIILTGNLNIKNRVLALPFRLISVVSLEMYLFSQMFDGFVYKGYIAEGTPFMTMFGKMPVLVGTVFALSFIASWGKRLVFAIGRAYVKAIAQE